MHAILKAAGVSIFVLLGAYLLTYGGLRVAGVLVFCHDVGGNPFVIYRDGYSPGNPGSRWTQTRFTVVHGAWRLYTPVRRVEQWARGS